MKKASKTEKSISRRGVLPILGSTFLIPFLGLSQPVLEDISDPEEKDYQILLKPDGTTVKVKRSTIENSKIVKKNVSNSSFLNWLGKKL